MKLVRGVGGLAFFSEFLIFKDFFINKAEQEAINQVLSETGGNREKAAEMLGIGRKTLYRKLRQYGIE